MADVKTWVDRMPCPPGSAASRVSYMQAEIDELRAALQAQQGDKQDAARYRTLVEQIPCSIADALECSMTPACIAEAVDEMIEDVAAGRAKFVADHAAMLAARREG